MLTKHADCSNSAIVQLVLAVELAAVHRIVAVACRADAIQLVTRLDVCVSSLRMGHTKRIEAAVQQCRLDSERTITGIKGFELLPQTYSEFEMVIELVRTND